MLDENDNSPRFDFISDSAISIPEDCPVGQRVATVKARDPDAGSNGQVGHRVKQPGSTMSAGLPQLPQLEGPSEPPPSPSTRLFQSLPLHSPSRWSGRRDRAASELCWPVALPGSREHGAQRPAKAQPRSEVIFWVTPPHAAPAP